MPRNGNESLDPADPVRAYETSQHVRVSGPRGACAVGPAGRPCVRPPRSSSSHSWTEPHEEDAVVPAAGNPQTCSSPRTPRARTLIVEGLAQRRPGGAQLVGGGADAAEPLGHGEGARSASPRSRNRLCRQPSRPGKGIDTDRPVRNSASVNGRGKRASHRSKNTPIAAGPSRSHTCCSRWGSLIEAKPLASSLAGRRHRVDAGTGAERERLRRALDPDSSCRVPGLAAHHWARPPGSDPARLRPALQRPPSPPSAWAAATTRSACPADHPRGGSSRRPASTRLAQGSAPRVPASCMTAFAHPSGAQSPHASNQPSDRESQRTERWIA
jgi:hypothetical protein